MSLADANGDNPVYFDGTTDSGETFRRLPAGKKLAVLVNASVNFEWLFSDGTSAGTTPVSAPGGVIDVLSREANLTVSGSTKVRLTLVE